MPTGLTLRSLRSQQETRFASGATPIVMTGLVPAIGRGTVALLMAGTRPAMTVTAGFTQGGPTDGRCELAMIGNPLSLDCPGQFLKQCLGHTQIGRFEAFGKSAVYRSQKHASFCTALPLLPEAGQAERGS